MKLEQAQAECRSYTEDLQRLEDLLMKQERGEKLKKMYGKYKSSIEQYIDNKIKKNYSENFIAVNLLQLAIAIAIDCEDLVKDYMSKVHLQHYMLGDYVILIYQENGFTVKLESLWKDDYTGQYHGDNCIYISGWR